MPVSGCCCMGFDRQPDGSLIRMSAQGKELQRWGSDTNCGLRTKFSLLTIFQIPLILVQVAYRILDTIALRFISRAREAATHEWTIARLKDPNLKEAVPFHKIVCKILRELIRTVFIVTHFPLIVLARGIAAVYGIIAPYSGRIFYAYLDRMVAIKYPSVEEKAGIFTKYGNYSAVCMQDRKQWIQNNLYRFSDSYDVADGHTKLNILFRKYTSYLPIIPEETQQPITRTFEYLQKLDVISDDLKDKITECDRAFQEHISQHLRRERPTQEISDIFAKLAPKKQ